MARRRLFVKICVALIATMVATSPAGAEARQVPNCDPGVYCRLEGTIGETAYLIERPGNWNGTLVLYSHGYTAPGSPNPAHDVGDPATGAWLLEHGYALAGSSYSTTGWALEQAFVDQTALLDFFAAAVGAPARTIAWGHSLGGIITAGLLQTFPERFDAGLPMCGVLAGGVGAWNAALDGAFVFKSLVAPDSDLQLTDITDPGANLALAQSLLAGAQQTAAGRARIALAASVGSVPGWFDPFSAEPGPEDYLTRQQEQFRWLSEVDAPFVYALRAELEARSGGNYSWNTDVDYRRQLGRSENLREIRFLYRRAGLSLDDDLRALEDATRIEADPEAVDYVVDNIIFNGRIRVPVLALHTTADGLVPVQHVEAYDHVVRAAGNGRLLRDAYVNRAGHCTFTPAETIAAFQGLVERLDTGQWDDAVRPPRLNRVARDLGPELNQPFPSSPAFLNFQPSTFLRPYDARRQSLAEAAA